MVARCVAGVKPMPKLVELAYYVRDLWLNRAFDFLGCYLTAV